MTNKRPWSIAELTAMVDQGRLIERERIIQLISTGKFVTGDQAFFLIEAIKGEQQ